MNPTFSRYLHFQLKCLAALPLLWMLGGHSIGTCALIVLPAKLVRADMLSRSAGIYTPYWKTRTGRFTENAVGLQREYQARAHLLVFILYGNLPSVMVTLHAVT